MSKTRIILVGPAASGKDYARKFLQKVGLEYQISFTTRPPRDNETNGVEYHFVSEDHFIKMIKGDLWYEYAVFKNFYYGTTKAQFKDKNSLFIMSPSGISKMSSKDRKESLIIYFNIPESVRKSRLISRNDCNDSLERRIESDRRDFLDFTDFDVEISNPSFLIDDLINQIVQNSSVQLNLENYHEN